MSRIGGVVAALAFGVAATLSHISLGSGSHLGAPPPAHTGGFDEPTCAACHISYSPRRDSDAWALQGLPERYGPGETYVLTLSLEDEWMSVAGFQAAVRYADGDREGESAGVLVPIGDHVTVIREGGVSYAHQTEDGAVLAAPGRTSWSFEWRAPSMDAGTVLLHATANAGNGDNSPLEDQVYLLTGESRPGASGPDAHQQDERNRQEEPIR